MNDQLNQLGSLISMLLLIGIPIIIFIVCRELVCWYWKLNRIVELLERIANTLDEASTDQRPSVQRRVI